jgi:hypothetical protein
MELNQRNAAMVRCALWLLMKSITWLNQAMLVISPNNFPPSIRVKSQCDYFWRNSDTCRQSYHDYSHGHIWIIHDWS